MLYIELLGTIIVLSSVGGMSWCVVAVAVMSPRGVGVPGWDSCVRLSVACFDVLCAVMFRLGASCFITLVFARFATRSLWVHAWAMGRSKPLFAMFIVNNIILYNLQL